MDIQGLQKLTLLDWPGRVACTIFLGGCDFRCPFCHNRDLVTGPLPAAMDSGELLAFLAKRKGLLDGVCVTGGEPLLRPGLEALLEEIKALASPSSWTPTAATPAPGQAVVPGAGGLRRHGHQKFPGAVRRDRRGPRPGPGAHPGERVLAAGGPCGL